VIFKDQKFTATFRQKWWLETFHAIANLTLSARAPRMLIMRFKL